MKKTISRLTRSWRRWRSAWRQSAPPTPRKKPRSAWRQSAPPTPRKKPRSNVEVLGGLASYRDNAAVIVQTDFEGRILHANPAAHDYFQTTECQSDSVYDYLHTDHHEVLDALFGLTEFTQPKVYRGVYLRGREAAYTLRYYHHPSLGAAMLLFVESAFDEAVVQAQEERKWAERLQIMLFGLNHELKTPLATARGYLDLARAGADASMALDGAEAALTKMSQILNDMTAPMRELAHEDGAAVDLGHCVDSYVKTMPFVEPSKRWVGSLEVDSSAAQGKLVLLSRPRLYQILTNLADNSIRATKHLEEQSRIRITAHLCDEPHHTKCVVLSFTDNGVGMDEDTLHKVFAPYFTTRGADAGSGLGSYFVYQFVREAGGSIQAESKPGQGTTMHLHLPYTEGYT